MSARQEIREQIVNTYGEDVRADILLESIDLIVITLVGLDDTMQADMPKNWNDALKKQYVNFRNHLRRAMRSKYGSREKDSE